MSNEFPLKEGRILLRHDLTWGNFNIFNPSQVKGMNSKTNRFISINCNINLVICATNCPS